MSGDSVPTVELFGSVMVALAQAIPQVETMLERKIVLVGGLAVLSRLRSAYRVTSDVDIVGRREADLPAQLDVLLSHGATAVDAAGAMIATPLGEIRVDTLEVSVGQLNDLPVDPTDRLYVLSHEWAFRTASPLRIQANDGRSKSADVIVLVAEPGPLIATKLQALPNRTKAKEATDLLDIIRLTLDSETSQTARAQLGSADRTLRSDAALHAQRWFIERAERTIRFVRSTPAGQQIDSDIVALVGELLLASLDSN